MNVRALPTRFFPASVMCLALLLPAAGFCFESPVELARRYQDGIGCPRDANKALFWYKRAAAEGDASAMLALGDMYDAGVCVPEDVTAAVDWYKQAAGKKFAPALMRLGQMTERARGMKYTPDAAIIWYEKAAALGFGPASGRLAVLEPEKAFQHWQTAVRSEYPPAFAAFAALTQDQNERHRLLTRGAELGDGSAMTGLGERASGPEAAGWFQKAAEAGDPAGMVEWAAICERGDYGTPQSTGQALVWYRKAAEKGSPAGLTYLGEFAESGRGMKQDLRFAERCYRQAAEARYPRAMTRLAILTREDDAARASALLREAAEAGDSSAMVELAKVEPERWWERAAAAGHPEALARLGRFREAARAGHAASMLRLGQVQAAAEAGDAEGMRRYALTLSDPGEQCAWMLRAAEAGDVPAMTGIGLRLAAGAGVAPDPVKARQWWTKAAQKGDLEAQFRLADANQDETMMRHAAQSGHAGAMVRLGEQTGNRQWFEKAAALQYPNAWTKLGELDKAAALGDPEALMLLGDRAKRSPEAYALYRKAAEAGYGPAMLKLARCHQEGRGTSRSQVDALHWYRAAAASGMQDAGTQVSQLERELH